MNLGLNACTKPQECAMEDVWAGNTEYITPASSFTYVKNRKLLGFSRTQPAEYFTVK